MVLSDEIKDILDAINIAILRMKHNGSILLPQEIYNVAARDNFSQAEADIFSDALAELIQVSFNAGSKH